MAVAILTDTNSGISVEEGARLGIAVIPMPLIIDGQDYLEHESISHAELYDSLRAKKDVTTSQPSPQSMTDMYDKLLANGFDGVVHIPMSSGLSNTCETATALAARYGGKVEVADNHRISTTLRESVDDAKILADAGCTAREIKEYLEAHAFDASIYVTVNSLEYLKKGGRITPSAAMIATVLDIKPVLTIQGDKLDSFKKIHGIKKSREVMIKALKTDIKSRFKHIPTERLVIGVAGTLETQSEIDSWLAQAKAAFPEHYVYYTPLSCSIACHVGIGAIGIGVSVKPQKIAK